MIEILPTLNVISSLGVIIFDGEDGQTFRQVCRGWGGHIRGFNQLVWQNVTLTSYFFFPRLRQAAAAAAARAAVWKQTRTANWKRDLNYLLSGYSCNSRPGEVNLLSAPECDSFPPIRPEWLLSSYVITILPFILTSMMDSIRKGKKQRRKSSRNTTKKEVVYEVRQVN